MKRTTITLVVLAAAAVFYLLAPDKGGQRSQDMAQDVPAPSEAPRPVPQGAPAVSSSDEGWSDTDPAVNLTHVFHGEVNRRGKPVGFHARPGGRNPSTARVVRVVDRPNRAGVYTADVEIRNSSGRWLRKRSTFYPDRLSRDQVVAAILHAWEERGDLEDNKFRGSSGQGFTIEGYTSDEGGINTAYPIFEGR
jgi:EndoU nuclease-like protein